MKTKKNEGYSFKDRFHYWFDNHLARSSLGFIRILVIASFLLAMLIAGLIILFHFNEEGEIASVFWDSFATVLNAWMPSSGDGSPGYLVLMAITAIAGILFTSVLIGIITSAIEEKIIELKKGNSIVLEQGHIVVLGFNPGEYTLLRQLILAAAGKPDCIVLADQLEREELEQYLAENLEVPKNFRIICRTADITDPASLEKCSIETCRTVIVTPTDDAVTIKAILAVSVLMQEKGVSDIRVNSILSKNQYHFPVSLAEAHNITTLKTNDILAKMIAHSCTQMGLSETFREVFNFEGSEFYLIEFPEMAGRTFENLMVRTNHGVPAGLLRDGKILLNPPAQEVLRAGDRVLVFAEEGDTAKLEEDPVLGTLNDAGVNLDGSGKITDTVIIGHNETLPVVLRELPENVSHVLLVNADASESELAELAQVAQSRNLTLDACSLSVNSEEELLALARRAHHIVILGDHDKSEEEADMEVIFLLLNFRDLRARFDLRYNITVEMQKEHSQRLVGLGDHTDFLVASSMSSLILAQLAESPELIEVFRELLSNKGNELYLKNAADSHLTGCYTVRELRRIVLRQGYIFLGIVDEEKRSIFNLPLDEKLTLGPDHDVIVLGED